MAVLAVRSGDAALTRGMPGREEVEGPEGYDSPSVSVSDPGSRGCAHPVVGPTAATAPELPRSCASREREAAGRALPEVVALEVVEVVVEVGVAWGAMSMEARRVPACSRERESWGCRCWGWGWGVQG